MSVSGRKISDFRSSISKGSTSDFDHSCDPCQAVDKDVEAEIFCSDCQEYLCKNCTLYHQRFRATKNHQLLNSTNVPRHATEGKMQYACTDRCSIHRNEIIKYFCTQHEVLGCTDCITLHHRTCDLDYIPDKCEGIGETDEFFEVTKNLEQKIEEAEKILKSASARDKEIDNSHDSLMREVIKYRTEINEQLDHLQNKIQTEANEKKSNDKQVIQSVIETCKTLSTSLKNVQRKLADNKASGLNGQVYIDMKRVKADLKSDELKQTELSLANTNMQYRFKRNRNVEDMLFKHDAFGNLQLSTYPVVHINSRSFDILTHQEDINIKTKNDNLDCFITGCAFLPSNKVLLADKNNKTLIVLDVQSKSVIREKFLDSNPWDIAVLPSDQIAVTLPNQRKILILESEQLLTLRYVSVKGKCMGIYYHQDQFYVACLDPDCIILLDTLGNIRKTITLGDKICGSPSSILFSEDSGLIYVSSFSSNSLVSMTLQGKVSTTYTHKQLCEPLDIEKLDDGSLLVCCHNGTVHHVSDDLKHGKVLIDGLPYPWSVCYNIEKHQVSIGSSCGKELEVFSFG